MEKELNIISKEEQEKNKGVNILSDYNNTDDGSKGYEKNRVGVWTEKQIAENPTVYLEYLRKLLKKNEYRPNVCEKITLEIDRVASMYLSNYHKAGRNR